MAKSEFSETQFVVGYLKELWSTRLTFSPFGYYFSMPSTIVEKEFPVDFYIDYYSHSEYYQFKRSDKISDHRGREIKKGLTPTYLPYFRFKIYNNISKGIGTGQFEKLKDMAAKLPNDFVGYCAPYFIDDWDYQHHYYNNQIISNSVLIDCNQFNDSRFAGFNINDGDEHYMVYNHGFSYGFLFSDPMYIDFTFPSTLLKRKTKSENFEKYVNNALLLIVDQGLKNGERSFYIDSPDNKMSVWRKAFFLYEHLFTNYGIIWNPVFAPINK